MGAYNVYWFNFADIKTGVISEKNSKSTFACCRIAKCRQTTYVGIGLAHDLREVLPYPIFKSILTVVLVVLNNSRKKARLAASLQPLTI